MAMAAELWLRNKSYMSSIIFPSSERLLGSCDFCNLQVTLLNLHASSLLLAAPSTRQVVESDGLAWLRRIDIGYWYRGRRPIALMRTRRK